MFCNLIYTCNITSSCLHFVHINIRIIFTIQNWKRGIYKNNYSTTDKDFYPNTILRWWLQEDEHRIMKSTDCYTKMKQITIIFLSPFVSSWAAMCKRWTSRCGFVIRLQICWSIVILTIQLNTMLYQSGMTGQNLYTYYITLVCFILTEV